LDTRYLDRIATALLSRLPRRGAVQAVAGSGVGIALSRLASNAAQAKQQHKPRCRKRREKCGGKKKCCGKQLACGTFPTMTCDSKVGKFCCGLEGAPCNNDPSFNNCDCCDGLYCFGLPGQPGQCSEQPS
jgi:hypothetical protein